jgi:hypothetical protein
MMTLLLHKYLTNYFYGAEYNLRKHIRSVITKLPAGYGNPKVGHRINISHINQVYTFSYYLFKILLILSFDLQLGLKIKLVNFSPVFN